MTQSLTLRTIAPHERAQVLDLLDEWISRDFFARYLEHDPTFRDDLCFVAADGGHIVATLQVFEKQVRVEGATVRVGGIGNVFTTPSHRGRGAASQLLERAIAAMAAGGFDLSLLFATRLEFYGRHGWRSHPRRLLFIDPRASTRSAGHAFERFDLERDLARVMSIYDDYSGRRIATTVRDRRYWLGQLRYAGNTSEDFFVVRESAGAPIAAYARGAILYGCYFIMEHGCRPGREDVLADLIAWLHDTEARSFPGTLTQLACEPTVHAALAARGLTMRTIDDVFWMWRVISPERVAKKLGLTDAEVVHENFWHRLLPPERSVYWVSDRF